MNTSVCDMLAYRWRSGRSSVSLGLLGSHEFREDRVFMKDDEDADGFFSARATHYRERLQAKRPAPRKHEETLTCQQRILLHNRGRGNDHTMKAKWFLLGYSASHTWEQLRID